MRKGIIYLVLVTVLLCGCKREEQNQPLSYIPHMTYVGKTATGCEIFDSKDIDAVTVFEDYAISISQINDVDMEFNVSIPQVEMKNQSQLNVVNQVLYSNGTLGELMNDSEVMEFESEYGITFAEYNVVSICQQGRCVAPMHDMDFARGCTFDRDTDTILTIDKYFKIENLMNLYDSGDLKIYMDQGYDDETIEMLIQDYVDSYGDSTNFFINQNSVFMIVPVGGANSTYFIVEAARN